MTLPPENAQINIEDIADRENLGDQFKKSELSDADLTAIANAYDLEEFLIFFGVLRLVARYYRLGMLTVQGLGKVLIGLGKARKISRNKAVSVAANLLNAGDITQNQYDAFITNFDNQVG